MFSTGAQIGNLSVVTSDRLLTPEGYADLALIKILYVSDTIPGPLRDQAHAFKDEIKKILIQYFTISQEAVQREMVNRGNHPKY
jgi:hypothetical protein